MEAVPKATVVTVKVSELDPDGMVREAGTVALPVLVLLKLTVSPDALAGTLD